MGCFSVCIEHRPKSAGGTLGVDGKMRPGKVTSNSSTLKTRIKKERAGECQIVAPFSGLVSRAMNN